MQSVKPPAPVTIDPARPPARSPAGRAHDPGPREALGSGFSDAGARSDALASRLSSVVSARAPTTGGDQLSTPAEREVDVGSAGVAAGSTVPPIHAPAGAAIQRMRGPRVGDRADLEADAIRHISRRHGPGRAPRGAGEFNRATFRDLRAVIRECVRDGRRRRNTGGRGGYIYEYEFDEAVGWDSNDARTYWLRVVVRRGDVVTAFPI